MTVETKVKFDDENKKVDPNQIMKLAKECSEVVINKNQYTIYITKAEGKDAVDCSALYKIKINVCGTTNLKYKVENNETILEKDLISFIHVLTSLIYSGDIVK